MQAARLLCRYLPLLALPLAAGPAGAVSQSDIVWPSFYGSEIQRPADPGLDCQALDTEIGHVDAGIVTLTRAQSRVEAVLHTAFDMERYGKQHSTGGTTTNVGAVDGKEAYAAAREQIIASRHNAQKRHDYLESLKPACKKT